MLHSFKFKSHLLFNAKVREKRALVNLVEIETFPAFLRYLLLLIMMVMAVGPGYGQAVISAAGTADYTLGEIAISSYRDGSLLINEGFHQPGAVFTGTVELGQKSYEYSIYPNPASQYLMLEGEEELVSQIKSLKIIDLIGREIHLDHDRYHNGMNIDLREVRAGFYQLLLYDKHLVLLSSSPFIIK